MSNSDWAGYQYVREGIRWYFVQQWAIEERRMLQLHAQRLFKWLKHQGNVLLNLFHREMRTDSHHLKELLVHSFRIMRCLFAKSTIPYFRSINGEASKVFHCYKIIRASTNLPEDSGYES
jgi:hypothetical protein